MEKESMEGLWLTFRQGHVIVSRCIHLTVAPFSVILHKSRNVSHFCHPNCPIYQRWGGQVVLVEQLIPIHLSWNYWWVVSRPLVVHFGMMRPPQNWQQWHIQSYWTCKLHLVWHFSQHTPISSMLKETKSTKRPWLGWDITDLTQVSSSSKLPKKVYTELHFVLNFQNLDVKILGLAHLIAVVEGEYPEFSLAI